MIWKLHAFWDGIELHYTDRRHVHNLKYYTWVEQQGRTYDDIQKQADEIDELIVEFNKEVGLVWV